MHPSIQKGVNMTRVLLLIFTCAVTPAYANDKALHALVGGAIYASTGSLRLCVAAGIGKEVWDSTGRGTVEALDAVVTILPCLVVHLIRVRRVSAERHNDATVDRTDLIEWANRP